MAEKARQVVADQPPLNSPPPQDLGPVDVQQECAKYGRTPLEAGTTSFSLEAAKNESPLGTTFWGRHSQKRNLYLVLKASRPSYMSRDTLDDYDLFNKKPGWYCDVEAVAVEPTPQEISADPQIAKAKTAAENARRHEIERLVCTAAQAKDSRLQAFNLQNMTKCWATSVCTYAMYADLTHLVYVYSSSDDWFQWILADQTLAAEALKLQIATPV